MNIEQALTKEVGDLGKKIHMGRSRNDLVATDFRLYLRDCVDLLISKIKDTRYATAIVAQSNLALSSQDTLTCNSHNL